MPSASSVDWHSVSRKTSSHTLSFYRIAMRTRLCFEKLLKILVGSVWKRPKVLSTFGDGHGFSRPNFSSGIVVLVVFSVQV